MLFTILLISLIWASALGANILMMTMGGTKSHKIPFQALAKGLSNRGHNVTLLSAFPNGESSYDDSIEEINPLGFVLYVKNFTDWDILGPRLNGEEPVPIMDIFRYGYQACEALLTDSETGTILTRRYDLLILDGAYPECALGLVHHYGVPFMFLNTVAFYTQTLSLAGNPSMFSTTPYLGLPFSDSMTLMERMRNSFWHTALSVVHSIMVRGFLEPVLKKHLGSAVPSPYNLAKNVSFILQNGHATLTYPRPYLPNVAEIACIHCIEPGPLPADLEGFLHGGRGRGFIYVSMGSSVIAEKMPIFLKQLFVKVFSQLPYQVLWKYDGARSEFVEYLPKNVRLAKWLPQQDLLGHEKVVAFVNHGGLLSLFEAVYHAVPVVAIPVFCDQDSNSAKAERDGFGIRLELKYMTADTLLAAITRVISDARFKETVKKKSALLKDQKESPLNRAVYWTEYILRHNGATHLHTPAKDMTFVQYFSLDIALLAIFILVTTLKILQLVVGSLCRCFRARKMKRD